MNKSHKSRAIAAVAFGLLLLTSSQAYAERWGGGNKPVQGDSWPDGVTDVANLKSRFRYSAGDPGDTMFLYRGDPNAFEQALLALAKVRAPVVELAVHDGPCTRWPADPSVNWIFTVWNAATWHCIYGNPMSFSRVTWANFRKPVPPPRIEVWAACPAFPQGLDWTQVKVPEGIRVTDDRASAKPPQAEAALRGAVYDMANGKRVAGAKIEAKKIFDKDGRNMISKEKGDGAKIEANQILEKGEWQAEADKTGFFQIEKLPLGAYVLTVSADGYAPRGLEYSFDAAKPLDLELSAAVTVEGTVTDDQDKPLAGVQVKLLNPSGIDALSYGLAGKTDATTDDSGEFSLPGVPSGYAQFECTKKGLRQLNKDTIWRLSSWSEVADGGRRLRQTGKVPVVLRMALPGTIRCKFVNPVNKPPKDDATIAEAEGGYFLGPEGFLKFQETEHFNNERIAEFTNLPPGRYYVIVGQIVSYQPDAKVVTVGAGQTVEVEVTGAVKEDPKPPKPVVHEVHPGDYELEEAKKPPAPPSDPGAF